MSRWWSHSAQPQHTTARGTRPRTTAVPSPASPRAIYTAPRLDAAETRFEAFAGEWEATYSPMSKAWRGDLIPSGRSELVD